MIRKRRTLVVAHVRVRNVVRVELRDDHPERVNVGRRRVVVVLEDLGRLQTTRYTLRIFQYMTSVPSSGRCRRRSSWSRSSLRATRQSP